MIALVVLLAVLAPPPVEHVFRTASNSTLQFPDEKTGECRFVLFANVGEGRRTFELDGRYVGEGVGWSGETTLRDGETRITTMVFRAGSPVAEKTLVLRCGDSAELPVNPDATVKAETGKPRLVLYYPRMLMGHPYTANVALRVAVEGEMTEEFYCPRVEVEWPDGTTTKRDSDCPPWEPGTTSGRINNTFYWEWPGGKNSARVCLYQGKRTLACETAEVDVVGGM